MAGKRLLDAAKILNVSSSIAKQHIVLRREQWELYTRTSSLAKAVKNQTDRVTVTASAAFELAKRFNDTAPQWQQRAESTAQGLAKDGRRAVDETVQQAGLAGEPLKDETHEHLDQRPGLNAEREVPAEQDHAQFRPTSSSQQDDGSLSSLRRRELQRQAEAQIPAVGSDDQSTSGETIGQDTFSVRSETTSPDLSSLPRIKLPRHSGNEQGHDAHVEDRQLNQDVYYAPQAPAEDIPKDVDTDIFASPKVAQMLGQGKKSLKNPYAGRERLPPKPLPEMVAASHRNQSQPQEAQQTAEKAQVAASDIETEDLAASIAQEAEASAKEVEEDNARPKYEMRESRVPSSRFGRLWQYGGLATSMAFGAVGESFRRITGSGDGGSLMLSEANMNRLVAKLSRMRGAALKLGQMMSFQDSKVLPPAINTVLQRVQDSADYMPPSQRNQVLSRNLGPDWRDKFSSFEEKPFAAASIGQVHVATLASNGKKVAVKVQYPGVRDSIDSDLNNLSLLLTASRLLPPGLFLDKTIANARTELGWECDYEREAASCIRFKELLADEGSIFAVPTIYQEACGPDVLTAEFMQGTGVTKVPNLKQEERDYIGTQILRLCLRELMEWRFMQTDPNWTNFLYDRQAHKLQLLDFGASRDFPDKFVEPYVSLLIAATKGDRNSCRDYSIELGYLTGNESQGMLKAHVDSILTLAEPFTETAPEVYDFKDQTVTDRVRANIGLMLRERMAPPPEETYSLHRKLSGAFLLCARLESRIRTRDMFADAVKVWNGRKQKVETTVT